jgi:hypothetical protein
MLVYPPTLFDEAASDLLELLYELTAAFENHYGAQIRRHDQSDDTPQTDCVKALDDNEDPF